MSKIKIYNLRLVPSQPVYDDVLHFKSLYIKNFGKHPLSKSKPHVTLAVFEMDSEYQDILVKVFSKLSIIKKFRLEIKGFDVFDNNTYVLFLKTPLSEEIKSIHKNIKILWARDLHQKNSSIIIPGSPHMTISKTLEKKTLYKSLDFFQKLNYTDKQTDINHIALISRNFSETWSWEHQIMLS